jgi:hypothetical protein
MKTPEKSFMKSFKRFMIVAAIPCIASMLPAARGWAAALDFPVVFNKAADLKKLGIVVKNYTDDSDDAPHFPNRCYSYGDGGMDISVAPEVLERFKARGFSRRSLCLGLVSEARFDPQSGKHLPTYVLSRNKSGKAEGAGDVSNELPLDLPDCFAGGRPLSDCSWNYDLRTGKPLPAGDAAAIAEVGLRLDAWFKLPANQKKCATKEIPLDSKDEAQELIKGTFPTACTDMSGTGHFKLPKSFTSSVSFGDVSSAFPKGYGYAFNADGGAGPDPSAAALKQAGDPKRRVTEEVLGDLQKNLSGQK